MKFIASLLVFVSLIRLYATQEPIIIPIQYVTTSDITTNPEETFLFSLKTCGGQFLDHCKGNLFVNFPNVGWNYDVGDVVYIIIYNSAGTAIGNNNNPTTNQPLQEFQFDYSKNDSDLLIKVRSGNAPTFKYTLTVTFTKCSMRQKELLKNPVGESLRSIQSPAEIEAWEKIKFFNPNVQELEIIFTTSNRVNTVQTSKKVKYVLKYCFDPRRFPGSIVVTTVATDEYSGFATYICTADIKTCNSTEDANYFDTSGAAANFVYVPITSSAQNGPVTVLVRGDGRKDKWNFFKLSGSRFFRKGK